MIRNLWWSGASHYKSFDRKQQFYDWFKHLSNPLDRFKECDGEAELIEFVANAKHPFQFLSRVVHAETPLKDQLTQIPVSMDASSSAYQIMSAFLLDPELAMKTNLIKLDSCDLVYDLYDQLLVVIKRNLYKSSLDFSIVDALNCHLSRNLIKKIFMPIVYGKTQHAAAADIYSELSFCLKKNECYKVAAYLFQIWHATNPAIVGLMNLFNQIGWFASYLDHPVRYESHYLETIKDYTVHKAIHVWLYDRKIKKRYQITLSVPTSQRNKTKSMRATFANRIHQFDSTIACLVIAHVKCETDRNIPLYTVHDNFITNAVNAKRMAEYYLLAFRKVLDPLYIVNRMLYQNIIRYSDQSSMFNRKELSSYVDAYDYLNSHFPRKGVQKPSHLFITREEFELVLKSLEPKGLKASKKKGMGCTCRRSH
jgi:DNA-directed RNA polymerase